MARQSTVHRRTACAAWPRPRPVGRSLSGLRGVELPRRGAGRATGLAVARSPFGDAEDRGHWGVSSGFVGPRTPGATPNASGTSIVSGRRPGPPGWPSSTGFSAAASSPGRSPCSGASRAWGSPRCCSRSCGRWPRAAPRWCWCRPRSRPHQVRLRAERLGPLPPDTAAPGRHRPAGALGRQPWRACPPALVVVDSIQAVADPATCRSARRRGPGPGLCRVPGAPGQDPRVPVRARRPRHQGRGPGRPPGARAPGRHGADASKETGTTPCAWCGRPSTGSGPPASSVSSRWATPAWRR